jgi:DNA-binding NarL/FixJ family response regulator
MWRDSPEEDEKQKGDLIMVRIMIANNSRLACDYIRTALDHEDGFYVVGCATTLEELQFLLPFGNMVLLSPELSDGCAFEVLEEIRATHPDVKVIVMGIEDRSESVLRYIEAGAAGYVLHNDSIEDMVAKLRAASEEKAIMSPSVVALLVDRLAQLANQDASLAQAEAKAGQLCELTEREQEVLDLISLGYTNQQIAEELVIVCGTVKNHVHNILKKLEVRNRDEAASIYRIQADTGPVMAAAI